MNKLDNHIEIIIEALEDYARWFDKDKDDKEKLDEINKAIEFCNSAIKKMK
jgi:hypothetical protein